MIPPGWPHASFLKKATCKVCGAEFITVNRTTKTCGIVCSIKNRQAINRRGAAKRKKKREMAR